MCVISCVASFAAPLWTSLLLPCSQPEGAPATQHATKEETPHVTFRVHGDNGYASIFAFAGSCWMV